MDDDFDWTLGSGLTTTTKTGPLKDHTRRMQAGKKVGKVRKNVDT